MFTVDICELEVSIVEIYIVGEFRRLVL